MAGQTEAEVDQNQLDHTSQRASKYKVTYIEAFGKKRKSSFKNKRSSRSSRVAPAEQTMMSKGSEGSEGKKRTSRRFRPQLKIDTKPEPPSNVAHTPSTAASSTSGRDTPVTLRDSNDLRSPGMDKTPLAAGEQPIPDFITQTDQYGNATTPRNAAAIQDAKSENKQQTADASDVDPCETLLDSIRLMCCCLVPEDQIASKPSASTTGTNFTTQVETQLTEKEDENKVRLLPPIVPQDTGKKCLVLDLDETLVHSSFRAVPGADFVIPVQIEDVVHFVYVAKRPGVDEFLVEMAKHYEIVVYTASLNKYADPLLDLLDTQRVIRSRLFRESCVYYEGNYVKDLSLLDRDLTQAIIVDNSPNSYIFHPDNAIDCTSFIDDPNDRELDQIGNFLVAIKDISDVRGVCGQWRDWPNVDIQEVSPENEYHDQ